VGTINTPTVLNGGFNFRQFWDGRAGTLEEQVDGPLLHPSEMGLNWDDALALLRGDADYARAFAASYPDGVTPAAVRDAIATFERSLITPNSRFDRHLRGEADVLGAEELEGYKLFLETGCVSCHQGLNVGGNMYQVFGRMGNYFEDRGDVTASDLGRFNVTGHERDRHKFKVPSLRNVELTAPYFHDGSAETLAEAVQIMARYQIGESLPDGEVAQLVAFLKTLTGENLRRP
jgi:cytochrome c peroxidase